MQGRILDYNKKYEIYATVKKKKGFMCVFVKPSPTMGLQRQAGTFGHFQCSKIIW